MKSYRFTLSRQEDYFTCRQVASGYDLEDPCQDQKEQRRQGQRLFELPPIPICKM